MEKVSENFVKENFFGLSYAGQVKIYNLYLDDFRGVKDLFEKYISVIEKFIEFKSSFCSFDSDKRSELRKVISRCEKFNGFIDVNDLSYSDDLRCSLVSPKKIDDCFVDKYIYDWFSCSIERRMEIVDEFINYYSLISDFDFNQILSLCFSNKDFFNREIKQLSYDFYSLYLCMDVVNRMMCIWHLSYSSYMDDGLKKDERVRLKKMFYDDNEFVTPMQSSGEITLDKRKKLSKYFKMDN